MYMCFGVLLGLRLYSRRHTCYTLVGSLPVHITRPSIAGCAAVTVGLCLRIGHPVTSALQHQAASNDQPALPSLEMVGVLCVLQVMPYVSLCAQKAAYLEKLLAPLNRTVKAMYGGLGGASITPGETGEHWLPAAAATAAFVAGPT